jgi:hypothetical protein
MWFFKKKTEKESIDTLKKGNIEAEVEQLNKENAISFDRPCLTGSGDIIIYSGFFIHEQDIYLHYRDADTSPGVYRALKYSTALMAYGDNFIYNNRVAFLMLMRQLDKIGYMFFKKDLPNGC